MIFDNSVNLRKESWFIDNIINKYKMWSLETQNYVLKTTNSLKCIIVSQGLIDKELGFKNNDHKHSDEYWWFGKNVFKQ